MELIRHESTVGDNRVGELAQHALLQHEQCCEREHDAQQQDLAMHEYRVGLYA